MGTWHAITGQPSRAFPDCRWTPAIEARLRHERFDEPSGHPASPGCFVARHVAPDRSLPTGRITSEHPGCDQDPLGGSLSLASKDPRILGGDSRTRFQRDWDFLRFHAERALERRHLLRQAVPNLDDYREGSAPRTWQMAEAIAAYAVQWKYRTLPPYPTSMHPVDTLLASQHCGGAANIAFALATVLGIPARRISTTAHSTCELLVDGRWCWLDNIRDGAVIMPCSYQEMLERVQEWPCLSAGQRAHHVKAEAFYRSPYDLMPGRHWRVGGEVPSVEQGGDVGGGYGISAHYDPSTAAALYPETARHRFHADACEGPTLTIGCKGAWLHATAALRPGDRLRRRLWIGECADNRVAAAELRTWCAPTTDAADTYVTWDGAALAARGVQSQRGCHAALVHVLDPARLAPGWHEVVIEARREVGLILFPDALEPYEPAASQPLVVAPSAVATDPVVDPAPAPAPVPLR